MSISMKFTRERALFGLATLLSISLLVRVSDILPPFIFSIILAYLAEPLVTRLERLGVRRSLASFILTIVIIGIIVTLFFFSVPFIARKILSLIKGWREAALWVDTEEKIFSMIEKIAPALDKELSSILAKAIAESLQMVGQSFESIGSMAIPIFKGFSDFAIMLFTPVLLYYTMKDWGSILREIKSLVPRRHLRNFLKIVRRVNDSVYMYLRGQIKVSSIMVVLYGTLLYFTPLSFGLALGVTTGICTIVPYIGFAVMSLIITLIAAQQLGGDPQGLIEVLTALMIGQILDATIITPKFMSQSIDLSPVWLIFGILSCSSLFGTMGAFLGLPILVICSALVRHTISVYKESNFYKEA